MFYLGAGTFKTIIKAEKYKDAEKILENMKESASKVLKGPDNACEFIRDN